MLPGGPDEAVRDRIVSEARGNPRTLHELARRMAPADLAGGFAVPDPGLPVDRLGRRVRQQLDSLPVATRQLLLVAAADPLGDTSLLRRASAHLGLGPDAATPAQAAGLIDITAHVRFSHPLLRGVVYRGSSLPERREVHRALAGATDPNLDPDRRAWHRAHATDEMDEDVAAELERRAGRAAARGGAAAAAAFLGRATVLTPDPARRGERALAAADENVRAGAFEQAVSMLATAATEPLDELGRARVDLTRGRLALAGGRAGEACALLLGAARAVESLDPGLSRDAYADALSAALLAGHSASCRGAIEVAQAARDATTASMAHEGDTLLEALAVRLTDGYAAAAPLAPRALDASGDPAHAARGSLRRLWLGSVTAADLWDDERWDASSARHVRLARDGGVLGELPLALDSRAFLHLVTGELAQAARLVREARAVCEVTGSDVPVHGALALAAWRGREGEARTLIRAALSEVVAGGEGLGRSVAHWASALLSNGVGQYENALAAGREAAGCRCGLSTPNWALVELIEAAARSGRTELASESLDRLGEMTRASGTAWALGVEARSRALLRVGTTAERLYREAIERLGRTRVRPELARAHLLYGEWLRRESRRVDARAQLREAHDLFVAIGMEGFAVRARRELLATGEKVRKPAVETRDDLTAQERHIAQLASDGLSNPEIGARLFLSPRTVEWHLRKVFTKLDIHARGQLSRALPSSDPEQIPA
jgi:DNA-binding CsgD family transcriptional regulator/tetratricopeptide (TPR) repeat protein